MGLFGGDGKPRPPIDITRLLIISGISIVLVNIIAGIIGIWVPDFAKVSSQVALGMLLFVVAASVIIPFMMIRRQMQGAGLTTYDMVFILLLMGFVIFLMIVLPNIFSLPKPFSIAQLNLQTMVGMP